MHRSFALLFPFGVLCCGGSPAAVRGSNTAAEHTEPATSAATSATPSASTAPTVTPPDEAPAPKKSVLVESEPVPLRTPLPGIAISSPTSGQLIALAKASETEVKLSVAGKTLGAGDVYLCVSLDGGACVRVDDTAKPLRLSELANQIAEGHHVLALIARHRTGEAVRPTGKSAAFSAVSFFVGKRTKPIWKAGEPLVVMLPPDGPPNESGEIVFDYYVANAVVADGKYLVQVALSGPGISTAETSEKGWPFRLTNARGGSYTYRVALARYGAELGESSSSTTVKYTSKTMTGPLVDSTRTFNVKGAR